MLLLLLHLVLSPRSAVGATYELEPDFAPPFGSLSFRCGGGSTPLYGSSVVNPSIISLLGSGPSNTICLRAPLLSDGELRPVSQFPVASGRIYGQAGAFAVGVDGPLLVLLKLASDGSGPASGFNRLDVAATDATSAQGRCLALLGGDMVVACGSAGVLASCWAFARADGDLLGLVNMSHPGGSSQYRAVAADGNVVYATGDNVDHVILDHYNMNGFTLVASTRFQWGGVSSRSRAVAVDDMSRVIVCGYQVLASGYTAKCSRWAAGVDAGMDTSFGTSGTFSYGTGTDTVLPESMIFYDGALVVGGGYRSAGDDFPFLFALDDGGSLIPEGDYFVDGNGGNGFIKVPVEVMDADGEANYVRGLTPFPGGLLVSGYVSTMPGGMALEGFVARYSATLTPAPTIAPTTASPTNVPITRAPTASMSASPSASPSAFPSAAMTTSTSPPATAPPIIVGNATYNMQNVTVADATFSETSTITVTDGSALLSGVLTLSLPGLDSSSEPYVLQLVSADQVDL